MISKLLKLSEGASLKVSQIGVVVCAIGAVNLFSSIEQQQAFKQMDAAVTESINDAKPVDGKSASEALREKTMKHANEVIANTSDNDKKLSTAASQFMGFYLVNVRTRPEYCLTLGVAIPTFVKEFEEINHPELIAARKALAILPSDEEKFYLQARESILKGFIFQIKDQAVQYKITEKQICEATELNAKEFASEMQFSKLMPLQSKTMTDASL